MANLPHLQRLLPIDDRGLLIRTQSIFQNTCILSSGCLITTTAVRQPCCQEIQAIDIDCRGRAQGP